MRSDAKSPEDSKGGSTTRRLPRLIALVCSGLAEGRNGVGDYCRQLAAALSRQGIDCALLALNDPETASVAEEAMDGAFGPIPLRRLPRALPRSEKLALAARELAAWAPDWVSLNFVSYGFNIKGIVASDLGWLPQLLAPYPLEIMFHETWIGQGVFRTPKSALVGAVQRAFIGHLARRLAPAVSHTSNPYYARMLAPLGLEAKLLPLFGNIPVGTTSGDAWLLPAIDATAGTNTAQQRGTYWLFGLFGRIVPQWPAVRLFQRLAAIAARAGRIPVVVGIGRLGDGADERMARWRVACPELRIVALGPRPTLMISEFLNSVDFGLTSHPFYMLGKSGTAAAFLEHGVPLIASWGENVVDVAPIEPPFDALVWRNDEQLAVRLMAPPPRQKCPNRVDAIAARLLRDLPTQTEKKHQLLGRPPPA